MFNPAPWRLHAHRIKRVKPSKALSLHICFTKEAALFLLELSSIQESSLVLGCASLRSPLQPNTALFLSLQADAFQDSSLCSSLCRLAVRDAQSSVSRQLQHNFSKLFFTGAEDVLLYSLFNLCKVQVDVCSSYENILFQILKYGITKYADVCKNIIYKTP